MENSGFEKGPSGTINPNLFRPKNQWTRYPAYCNHCRSQSTSEKSCLESSDKKFYLE